MDLKSPLKPGRIPTKEQAPLEGGARCRQQGTILKGRVREPATTQPRLRADYYNNRSQAKAAKEEPQRPQPTFKLRNRDYLHRGI